MNGGKNENANDNYAVSFCDSDGTSAFPVICSNGGGRSGLV